MFNRNSSVSSRFSLFLFIIASFLVVSCGSDDSDNPTPPSNLFVTEVLLGGISVLDNSEVTSSNRIVIEFNKSLQASASDFVLEGENGNVSLTQQQSTSNNIIVMEAEDDLQPGNYTLTISNTLTASDNATFSGASYEFTVLAAPLTVQAGYNTTILSTSGINRNIPLQPTIQLQFSEEVSLSDVEDAISVSPAVNVSVTQVNENIYSIDFPPLAYWKSYQLEIDESLGESVNRFFPTQTFELFTTVDSTYKFPEISDDELLTKVQEQTFKYFWEFGHPVSGMARERNTSGNTVTTGGTGFGLLAMIVAVERGFITRQEAVQRWETIISFLEDADRFHGAWPHWMNGETGNVIPFSDLDNGADLVETAFLVQGLLTVQKYLNPANTQENELIGSIQTLWEEVEWDWFTKGGEDVLYWHWSPENEWAINLKITGHNETQIVYILAASSPTHSISAEVYENGYTQNGGFTNGNTFYGYTLPLGNDYGGPLFFAHYSYLALNPMNLEDQYTSYLTQNENHTLINYNYCIENPQNYVGYSEDCWGLTASDGDDGYSAHSPTNDRGVITPTAAVSSIPYTPEESMDAIRFFYYIIGDRIWGEYGFHDAFNATEEWYADSYLAIDQGPMIVMIENYRTQLLWDLFMDIEDVHDGLNKLNFSYE